MKKIYAPIFLFIISCSCLHAQTQYTWVQKASFPAPARHRTIHFAIGNRGYVGTGHYNSVVDTHFKDWWEYDPGSNSWTQKADFGGGKRMHAAGFAIGNKGYAGTGRDINQNLLTDFWEYNPATNIWTKKADFAGAGRRGAVGFSIKGKGYIGTGSYYSDFWEYDPVSDQWTQKTAFPGSGRISAVGFTIGGNGYIGTGDDGFSTNDFYQYDPVGDSWAPKATVPGPTRMEAGGFVLNGLGYIGAGDNYSSGPTYKDFWCYTPATDSWLQVADLAGSTRRYPATFTIGSNAFVGLGTNGTNFQDLWAFGGFTGIEEKSEKENTVSIFPNPMKDVATVLIDPEINLLNCKIQIADMNGKILKSVSKISSHKFEISGENISPGIYFLQLVNENYIAGNFKFTIQ